MKKAFTLIEILIVVILLGILAAVVIPQFIDQSDVVNKNAAATEVSNLNSAWQQYVAATIAAGNTVDAANYAGFTAAVTALSDGKYIDSIPKADKYDGYTMSFAAGTNPPMTCKFSSAVAVAP